MHVRLDEHDAGCTPLSPCRSCRIFSFLREKLNPEDFKKFREMLEYEWRESHPIFDQRIHILQLKGRVSNCLAAENIYHIGTLIQLKTEQELMRIPNMGEKAVKEVLEALKAHNLAFSTDVGKWMPPKFP